MLSVFQIHEPATVEEASRLLTEHGSDAAVYAGGTELLVIMKERLVHFPHLINIKTIPGIDRIRIDGDSLVIGALATHRQIERSPLVSKHLPLLTELERVVANPRVRSTGTIGGNLCFAEPHSDPATLLIAWDASVVLQSGQEIRRLPLADFFTGLMETARRPDEILISVRIPVPATVASAYERFKVHERPTATVAVALSVEGEAISDARIVVGSVGEKPERIAPAERALIGAGEVEIEAVAAIVHDAVRPTEDKFESVDYKRHLAHVLTRRAIIAALERGRSGFHAG